MSQVRNASAPPIHVPISYTESEEKSFLLEQDGAEFSQSDSALLAPRVRSPRHLSQDMEQWRLDLVEMDKVDVLDKFDTWYPATIVRIRSSDLVRIHYDGFAESYDEWIERSSSRLALFESRTKESGRLSTVVCSNTHKHTSMMKQAPS